MDIETRLDTIRLVLFANSDLMMDCRIEQDHILMNSHVTLVIPTVYPMAEVRRVLLHTLNAIQASDNAKGIETVVQHEDIPNESDWLDLPF